LGGESRSGGWRRELKGNITVTESALAAILGLAAHEVPGVLGMSPAGIRESISRILGRSEASEGVVVKPDPTASGKYQADLYVVVAFGARIPTVVDSIGERVRWAAKSLAGAELSSVRVHVVGVSRG
jgi:uncharacterized alkaline shock family protein YloU